MSACTWHQRSDCAPPPRILRLGSGRRTNPSTASSNHRALKATPSRTARLRCSRPLVSDTLRKSPPSVRSSTGLRSPLTQPLNPPPPHPPRPLPTPPPPPPSPP